MVDPKRFDPALLAQRQRDEKPELDQFGDGEVLVQLVPQDVIGDLGVPRDGARIGKRDLLAVAEFV